MWEFIGGHVIEIIFALISAGALAFCKYMHSQMKNYKKLLEEKETDELQTFVDSKIEPIQHEIEELRAYIRELGTTEKAHLTLILSSYRFRLIQLCKEFLRQGHITPVQYDQITEFYKVYTGLGGNGQAKEYYESVMKLPIHD